MEEALEADLKQRVDRLRGTCDQRAFTLRQEHEQQLGKLDRAAGGGSSGGRSASATTPGLSAPAPLVEILTATASTSFSRQQHHTEGKKEPNDTTEKVSTESQPRGQNEELKQNKEQAQEQAQQQEREQERDIEGGGTFFSRQSPPPLVTVPVVAAVASLPVPIPVPVQAPAPVFAPVLVPGAVVVVADHARKKEMVNLRGELGRHLAVAHADGGRHLREATRVMRLIEEVEVQTRLEAEVCVEHFPSGTLSVFVLQESCACVGRTVTIQSRRLFMEYVNNETCPKIRESRSRFMVASQ